MRSGMLQCASRWNQTLTCNSAGESTIHMRARLEKANEVFVSVPGGTRGWKHGSRVMHCLACWKQHGETLGYGSLNPYLRVMLGAALTLPQKSAQNERTSSISKILVMKPRSKWSGRMPNDRAGFWMLNVLISLLKGSQVKVLPSKSGHLNSIPGASTEGGENKFSQAVLWPSYKHCIVILCFVCMGVYANIHT